MPSRRTTGGLHEFVDSNYNSEALKEKLGKHAKIGGGKHFEPEPHYVPKYEPAPLERRSKTYKHSSISNKGLIDEFKDIFSWLQKNNINIMVFVIAMLVIIILEILMGIHGVFEQLISSILVAAFVTVAFVEYHKVKKSGGIIANLLSNSKQNYHSHEHHYKGSFPKPLIRKIIHEFKKEKGFVKRKNLHLIGLFIFTFVLWGFILKDWGNIYTLSTWSVAIIWVYILNKTRKRRFRWAKAAIIVFVVLLGVFTANIYADTVFEKMGVETIAAIPNNLAAGFEKGLETEYSFPVKSDIGEGDSPLIKEGYGTQSTENSFGIISGPNIGEIEQMIFESTNKLRQEKGLHVLRWDDALAGIAREHSQDMADRGFFAHENPEGQGPTERASSKGINVRTSLGGGVTMVGIGENISQVPTGNVVGCGYVYSSEDIANCAMRGWINSPGHYSNMVNLDYRTIGVGVGKSGSRYYLTQNFR